MTKSEKVAALQKLYKKADGLVKIQNEATLEGNMNPTVKIPEIVDGKDTGKKITAFLSVVLEQTVNEYTAIAREICFEECLATDDPMLEAVKRLVFQTIGIATKMVGDEGAEKIPVSEVVYRDKAIDLWKLHKKSGDGIGKNKDWNGFVEKMNFYMTARQAKRLLKQKQHLTAVLKEIHGSYKMGEIAKAIEMGKDPTSNTKLLGTLQSIINAMIGEDYKATSHDVNYLCDLYARKGKTALSVNCANHSYFRGYIAAICHGLVTGEDYDISFKKANAK